MVSTEVGITPIPLADLPRDLNGHPDFAQVILEGIPVVVEDGPLSKATVTMYADGSSYLEVEVRPYPNAYLESGRVEDLIGGNA